MINNEDEAKHWLVEQGLADASAMDRLHLFIALLAEENQSQNLVAANSLGQGWVRHICDSAQLLNYVPRGTAATWLDLGTGAGFPGIVVAMLRPDCAFTLVESRSRRVDWLQRVNDTLELRNVTILGSRLERVGTQAFDVISARAFAPLDPLLAVAARFSTSATQWLLPKGRSAAQELAELRGWDHTFHVEQSLTDPQAGIVVGTLAGRKG